MNIFYHFLSFLEGLSVAKICLAPNGTPIRLVLWNSEVRQYEETVTTEQG